MTQVFQMTAACENLPDPGNTEGGFLSVRPTAVLQPLLPWLCEWCLTSPKWPLSAVPAASVGTVTLSVPSKQRQGLFLPQTSKEGILQVVRNMVTVLQS